MVVVLISFLLVIALARLEAIQADAERVAVETVAGTLRSALGMKVAEFVVRQDFRGLQALHGSNPMDRLAELPRNYLGELERPNPAALEDGFWYFDKAERALVYLVRNREHFSGGVANPPRMRFTVELVYRDSNRNGMYDERIDSIEGVRLAAKEPYRWVAAR